MLIGPAAPSKMCPGVCSPPPPPSPPPPSPPPPPKCEAMLKAGCKSNTSAERMVILKLLDSFPDLPAVRLRQVHLLPKGMSTKKCSRLFVFRRQCSDPIYAAACSPSPPPSPPPPRYAQWSAKQAAILVSVKMLHHEAVILHPLLPPWSALPSPLACSH